MQRTAEARISLGIFLRQQLENGDLDLDTLSRGCGVSCEHLAQLIAAERMLTGDVALALAGYFDQPAVEFLDMQRNDLMASRDNLERASRVPVP